MSYLQNQLSAFQSDVSSSANRFSQKRGIGQQPGSRSSPAPAASTAAPATSSQQQDQKRKRPDPSSNATIYSQPADTGTGRHLMTQVAYAVEHLKSKDKAISLQDIFGYLSIQEDEQSKATLEQILKTHSKVDYSPEGFGGKGSFRFRPTHNVRSAEDLVAFLQEQTTAQGIQVRELKDGWPGALDAIDALEAEGKLSVTRNKKDQAPRMVWSNDPSLSHPVDPEFQDLWHKTPLPSTDEDLRKELVNFGLTPTSQVKAPLNAGKPNQKKKKASRRGGKTTNTHMAGILKDFSHLRR